MKKNIILWIIGILIFFYNHAISQTPEALLWKTGQKISYVQIEKNDDGAFPRGISWPVPRFIDHNDGTVTDNLTGLMWLKDSACFNQLNLKDAYNCINDLNKGNSEKKCHAYSAKFNDWRIPNINEIRSLIDYSQYNPALMQNHPFTNLVSDSYWASSFFTSTEIWIINFQNGDISTSSKSNKHYLLPVRKRNIPPDHSEISVLPHYYSFSINNNSMSFNVKNKGNIDLLTTKIQITGPNFDNFTIGTDSCTNNTVLPYTICSFEISFVPESTGLKRANIEIFTNDFDTPVFKIPINGSSGKTYSALPEQTGQKSSFYPNDDGDVKRGIQVPLNRYIDNNDGTITDTFTGLMWFENAGCAGKYNFNDAVNFSKQVNISYETISMLDCNVNTIYNDWKIPNKNELLSLIDFSNHSPALQNGFPFIDLKNDYYYCSTSHSQSEIWTINMDTGELTTSPKSNPKYVWLVRSIRDNNWFPDINVSHSDYNFGRISVNTSSNPLKISINNNGQSPLVLDTILFNNLLRQTNDFVFEEDNCSGTILESNESCFFSIKYSPKSEGEKTDKIIIKSNDQNTPKYYIELTGLTDIDKYYVGIAKSGIGTGKILIQPLGYVCDYDCTNILFSNLKGSVITLSLSPGSGSIFKGWSGDCSGTQDCTITINKQTEIWANIDHKSPSPVIRSGQTEIFASPKKNDDGFIKRGIKWPDKRFKDQSDGTIVDTLTGLMWLKHADCIESSNLKNSIDKVNELNNDSDTLKCHAYNANYNDWRLPNKNELISIIDFSKTNPAVFNNLFVGMSNANYWSSSFSTVNNVWIVNMANGDISTSSKTANNYSLPVRIKNAEFNSDINVWPNTFDFAKKDQISEITLSNVGSSDLKIFDISIDGSDINDFQIIYDSCSDKSITSGNFCILKVKFLPQSKGYKYSSLIINSNDNEKPQYIIPVKGAYESPQPAIIPQTGQEISYAVRYIGDDGTLRRGMNIPEQRYIDHGDGTVTDRLTGIMWLKDSNCFNKSNFIQAVESIQNFNQNPDDFSCHAYTNQYSDWILPNKNELKSLINYSYINPVLKNNHSFTGVQNSNYWTSTPYSGTEMWCVNIGNGDISTNTKSIANYIWPMRYIKQTENYPEILISPYDFTFKAANESQTFTISNTGNDILNILDISLFGANSIDYDISNDNCLEKSLSFSQKCSFTVSFNPQSGGLKRSIISIKSNDPDTMYYKIPLKGYNEQPQFAMTLQTGQIIEYSAGDDADFKRGFSGQDPRFIENNDGTITDLLTGLMWIKDADSIGSLTWKNALESIKEINSGQKKLENLLKNYNDWRLPNKNELLSLIDFSNTNPALPSNHIFSGISSNKYWSSTSFTNNEIWIVNMAYGELSTTQKTYNNYVLAVRSINVQEDYPKIIFSAAQLSFDNIEIGNTSEPKTIQITNQGNKRLVIDTGKIIGNDASMFNIISDHCSGQILNESSTCSISVSFAPESNGSKTALLQIKSNNIDNYISLISLNGTTNIKQYVLTVINNGIGNGLIQSEPEAINCEQGQTCKAIFDQGTNVILKAVIGPGSIFKGWYGDSCSGIDDCTIQINSNTTITANITLPQPAPIWKTGQIDSYAVEYKGDDGALKRGVRLPEKRFVNNSDGTVTDNLTGLMWLKNSGCFESGNWNHAFEKILLLNQNNADCYEYENIYNDWRLPNINELSSLIDYSKTNPAISDDNFFTGLENKTYWTSTPFSNNAAWIISMSNGDISTSNKSTSNNIWAVRSKYSPVSKANIQISPTKYMFNKKGKIQEFKISNTGNEELIISKVLLTGDDISSFDIVSDNCSDMSLPFSSNCTIEIKFDPDNQGIMNSNLNIFSNDINNQQMIVKISGWNQMPQSCASAATGQNESYAERYSGDDGALKRGKTLPEPRFIIHSDGTVTDRLTSLMWLADASCFGAKKWKDAFSHINDLNFNPDNSLCHGYTNDYKNWRLPNITELRSIIDFSHTNPAVSNTFAGIKSDYYWTHTSFNSTDVWQVNIGTGEISTANKNTLKYILPVRTITHTSPYPDIHISPSTYHFSAKQTKKTFVISNTGDSLLEINNISLKRPNADEFIIQTDNCSNKNINPLENCIIEIMFAPNSSGAKIADIVISSNDQDSINYIVPISGNLDKAQPTVVLQSGQQNIFVNNDDGTFKRGFVIPDQRYIDNGDGTITDKISGLMWLANGSCLGKGNWQEALSKAKDFNLDSSKYLCSYSGEYKDFRLPDKNELLSIVDYSQSNPSLKANNLFRDIVSAQYWTSTPYSNTEVWNINLSTGDFITTSKSSNSNILLVRKTYEYKHYPELKVNPDLWHFIESNIPNIPSSRFFSISNKGNMKLSIYDIFISGRDFEDFVILSDNCTGHILEDNSCSVNLAFLPQDNGNKEAFLSIRSNDQISSVHNIPISGDTIIPQYKLKITKTGKGTALIKNNSLDIDCNDKCEAMFDKGSIVSVFLMPGSGTEFNGWSDQSCSSNYTCTLTINNDTILDAKLDLNQPAIIPETGQKISYASKKLKDDGELQRGIKWPYPRFIDHSDGTVTDKLTGLMWMKNTDCFGSISWSESLTKINEFNSGIVNPCYGYLNDYNDWRMPNISEMKSLIDYSKSNPAIIQGHPFSELQNNNYWTSTPFDKNSIWCVNMGIGDILSINKNSNNYIWIVRSGHKEFYSDISVSPVNIYFAETNINRTITIASTGNSNLNIDQILLKGPDYESFTIIADTCSNNELIPGNTCNINVQFSPYSVGNKNSYLEVSSDDSDTPIFKVYLNGLFGLCQASPVQQTGQKQSHAVRYKGDDGALKRGLAWPENRFVDNNDGTVIDVFTGLQWLKNPECLGRGTWKQALDKASDFNKTPEKYDCITNYDQSGLWRLAQINEIRSLIDYSKTNPALIENHFFTNIQNDYYWSQTPYSNTEVWKINMSNGEILYSAKSNNANIWLVKSNEDFIYTPDIYVLPDSLDFGNVTIRTFSQFKTIIVSNSDNDSNLVIDNITLSGSNNNQFDITGDGCSKHVLSKDETCEINIAFHPTTSGEKKCYLIIPSNDREKPAYSVFLKGTGTDIELIIGDLNRDGFINLKDAFIGLQLSCNILPSQSFYVGAEVNGDSKIGIIDVIYIMQLIAQRK